MRSTSGTGIVSARAEHEAGRHLLRHLVDGARAVDVPAAQRLQQHAVVEHRTEVVRVRVAEVHRDRVVAVRGADLAEPPSISANASSQVTSRQSSPLADQRRAHAVGIGLELLDRGALRAQVAVTEHVVAVAAHEA